jgi:acetolactate synthase-1/2/3 large subunit
MGFGLPAAFGAQRGQPDRTVVTFIGDGGFQMTVQELGTIWQNKAPVKIVLLNNNFLGMVRQWQQLFFDRRYSHTYLADKSPDFVALAEAYGAAGILVERDDEVLPALERAMSFEEGPVLIDFHTAPEENVFPMVPAGKAIDQMLSGMA